MLLRVPPAGGSGPKTYPLYHGTGYPYLMASTQDYTMVEATGATEKITAPNVDTAVSQLKSWLESGDHDTSDGTVATHGLLYLGAGPDEDEDAEPIERVDVEIHPPEPTADHAHEWDAHHTIEGGNPPNPGVFGSPSGGGVVITYHCRHAGCVAVRKRDTNATNMENGACMDRVWYEELAADLLAVKDALYADDSD